MPCPVCISLLREDHLLDQVEAALTLRRRADKSAEAGEDGLEMLLATRKQQARIMSRLETHRADAHPIPA